MSKVKVSDKITIGSNEPLALIAGPCVIESLDFSLFMAEKIMKITQKLGIPFIFKSSFDKANRTSVESYRGTDLKDGLKILRKVSEEFEIPTITDIHESYQAEIAAEYVDMLQIPAFLCRQTDLLIAAGETGKPINIKKGQFLAPWDMKSVIKKVESTGNMNILLTERGTTFGYNNLVVDFKSLVNMAEFDYPVVFDATHSVQLPGGMGDKSGGHRELVPVMARAAVAVGVNALFMEVHENPEIAPSDGPNMLHLSQLLPVLTILKDIDEVIKNK